MWPIFKILSLLDSAMNLQRDPSHLKYVTTPPCETYAADTFDFQQVTNDVRGRVQVGKTKLIFVDHGVKSNGTYCHDVLLTEQLSLYYCRAWDLWPVLYLPARPSSCTPSLRDNQPSGMGDTCFHFTRSVAPNYQDLNPVVYRIWE